MATASTTVTVTIPTDLRDAIRTLAQATESLAAIASLPTRIGARVRWTNGVIWTRVGDNEWQPAEPELTLEAARDGGWTSRSAHIASGRFEVIEDVS